MRILFVNDWMICQFNILKRFDILWLPVHPADLRDNLWLFIVLYHFTLNCGQWKRFPVEHYHNQCYVKINMITTKILRRVLDLSVHGMGWGWTVIRGKTNNHNENGVTSFHLIYLKELPLNTHMKQFLIRFPHSLTDRSCQSLYISVIILY